MTLGEKIREVREQKGVSQYDLSRSIFVAQDEIRRWELDKSIPSKKRLEDLEKFFELEKNYFISEEEYEILDKEYEKKRRIKKILKIAKYPLILVVLIFILQFAFLPRKGKIYEIDGKTYAVYENKGYFGDGVVEFIPSDSPVVNIPDTISVWNGIYFFKFKVKYVFLPGLKDKNASIDLPRYFEDFCNTYPEGDRVNFASIGQVEFENLSVSAENKKYDSRDNCGCLIETATNTILYNSKNSFIPEGVKEIKSDGMASYFIDNNKLIIPDSIEKIEDFAFGNYPSMISVDGKHQIKYIDFGSVKEIGRGMVSGGCVYDDTVIVLPKTLERINNEAFVSICRDYTASIFYEGTKDDWDKVVKYSNYTGRVIEQDDIYLGDPDYSGGSFNFYYYSEEEPEEKNIYWHYDEFNNPMIWS